MSYKSLDRFVWHVPLLSVQWINSWWWTEELSETCRVSCQNKFLTLAHLVVFIIKKFVTKHSNTNVKFNQHKLRKYRDSLSWECKSGEGRLTGHVVSYRFVGTSHERWKHWYKKKRSQMSKPWTSELTNFDTLQNDANKTNIRVQHQQCSVARVCVEMKHETQWK